MVDVFRNNNIKHLEIPVLYLRENSLLCNFTSKFPRNSRHSCYDTRLYLISCVLIHVFNEPPPGTILYGFSVHPILRRFVDNFIQMSFIDDVT